MMKNFILFVSFLIFHSYHQIHCAQEHQDKNYNIRDLIYTAIVIDRNPEKIEQYLQEGFALAQFYSNRDRLHEGREKKINAEKWLHQYFMYPQPIGPSKNLMQILLTHERIYSMQDKRSDFFKIGQLLLRYNFDVNALNATGNSIVHCIAKLPYRPDHLNFFEQLIVAGSDMNRQNQHGDTPVHLAMSANQPHEFILSIVRAGGDLHVVNIAGKTPLDYASSAMKKCMTVYPILSKKVCSSLR